MMEGDIWVESEFGKGSIFHFTARFACRKIKPAIKVDMKPEERVGQTSGSLEHFDALVLQCGNTVNQNAAFSGTSAERRLLPGD